MSERSRGRPVAAPGSGEPETSPGPPFLANVCVLLVARLAGAEAVTSKLSGGGVPLRLYWRSPLLQPAEALLMDSSHGRRPSASASQGLVAFVGELLRQFSLNIIIANREKKGVHEACLAQWA